MDQQFCHYHNEKPATWECYSCERTFGDCCTPINLNDPVEPSCPLCKRKLAYLGAANTAQPFWERISFFFNYAKKKDLLLFYLVASIALMSSFLVPYVGLFLQIIVICAITKYLCSVLIFVSEGENEAPPIGLALQSEGFLTFFKIVFLFLAIGVFIFLMSAAGGAFAVFLTILLVALLFPAMIIVLVLENSLSSALNPNKLYTLISAMGWHYLILWLFLFIVTWISSMVVSWLVSASVSLTGAKHVLFLITGVVLPLVSLYFYTVMFSMMGYAVYQYQGALGNVVGDWTEGAVEDKEFFIRKARALSEIYVREGRHHDALDALKSGIEAQPKDVKMHERYHRLLLTHGTPERSQTHLMRFYLPLLLSQEPARAIDVYLGAKKKLGNIPAPNHPMVCETLAQELVHKGHPAEAMNLIQNFHQRFPDYSHTPRVYLMAAKTFAHFLNNADTARRLIAFIRKHYPKFSRMAEVNALGTELASNTGVRAQKSN